MDNGFKLLFRYARQPKEKLERRLVGMVGWWRSSGKQGHSLRVHGMSVAAALVAAITLVNPMLAQSAGTKRVHDHADWAAYNGGQSGDHYSGLTQINRENVVKLKQVWVFDLHQKGGLETNPLMVGRTLYAYDTEQSVIALDAVTGKKLWSFVPKEPSGQPSRGLSYWSNGTTQILFAGMVSYLYALDPA
ncbi:MAG: hypothetical protein WA803_20375, partial [Steroidobacteraceae bacterium]